MYRLLRFIVRVFLEEGGQGREGAGSPDRRHSRRLYLKSLNDRDEFFYRQGSSANQTAVYIGFADQLFCVTRIHAASIEDGGIPGDGSAILSGDGLPDMCVYLLRLVGRSRFACTDSPYRFVGNGYFAEIQRRKSIIRRRTA